MTTYRAAHCKQEHHCKTCGDLPSLYRAFRVSLAMLWEAVFKFRYLKKDVDQLKIV